MRLLVRLAQEYLASYPSAAVGVAVAVPPFPRPFYCVTLPAWLHRHKATSSACWMRGVYAGLSVGLEVVRRWRDDVGSKGAGKSARIQDVEVPGKLEAGKVGGGRRGGYAI